MASMRMRMPSNTHTGRKMRNQFHCTWREEREKKIQEREEEEEEEEEEGILRELNHGEAPVLFWLRGPNTRRLHGLRREQSVCQVVPRVRRISNNDFLLYLKPKPEREARVMWDVIKEAHILL
ncbi:hypothetical protein EYF80_043733 [Liparis tanakae]|uniref:Uncharacterized protein n=1 Tax=Liparis tanakae TaxID=230148 RepID=A0A4Z2FXY1_9TELE|nr:hypothetical protein EYF80_043733 [Liparis tanakae]